MDEKEEDWQALLPEVEAMDTCMCYCQLGVLLGGAPGSSSKSKNSWEPKLEKIVGILVLR